MTAFGASVSLRPPAGLTVTRLTGTGGLSGWACALKTLSCRGNLPAGDNGQISVTGTVAARAPAGRAPASQVPATAMIARATVTGTNQSGRPVRRAAVPVREFALPAPGQTSPGQAGTGNSGAGPPAAAPGAPTSSIATFGLIAAVLLVVTGTVLAVVTRRRRAPGPGTTLAAPGPGE
jgi:hypothetical protein